MGPSNVKEGPSFFDIRVPSASIRVPPGWYADTVGTRMVRGWYTDGTRIVPGWYADGARMVRGWYADTVQL